MKRALPITAAILVMAGLMYWGTHSGAKWSGVDESVVEKFATAAGRPPQRPVIDIEHGDLPLFCFLVAGSIGGFIAGYYFRELFPPVKSKPKKPIDV